MKLITKKAAQTKRCPWMPGIVTHCIHEECMGWIEVYPRMERENHSRAKEMMLQEGVLHRGGQQIRTEGPDNSMGLVILDALGYCARNVTQEN